MFKNRKKISPRSFWAYEYFFLYLSTRNFKVVLDNKNRYIDIVKIVKLQLILKLNIPHSIKEIPNLKSSYPNKDEIDRCETDVTVLTQSQGQRGLNCSCTTW